MLKSLKYLVVLVVLAASQANGRVLNECEIARELNGHGFARNQLPDWVCLVESESGGNTAAVGGPNSDGSHDYGLFQINDRYWCEHGSAGKECNIECNQLLSDDITVSSQCAQQIYRAMGFGAWNGWKSKCQGNLPNVDHCF